MLLTEDMSADRRQLQARRVVLIALLIGFSGAMLGVLFGIAPGTVSGLELWIIAFLAVISSGLIICLMLKPAMATGSITAILTIYFTFHLNAGAIAVYQASGDIVRTIPYVTWFFPLVVFHQLTNFGFHKRLISGLVSLSPLPVSAYVLTHSAGIANLDAVVTCLFSFFSFVVFVGYFTRHRDEEIQRAAMAEEASRNAAVLRISEERFRLLGLATNDLVWDVDLKAKEIWWSDALCEIYGYGPRESGADLKTWKSWIHPDERERVLTSLNLAVKNGNGKWTDEYRMLGADGRALDVVSRGMILRDDSGEPIRLVGSTTDVTELRDLEKRLRQSQKMEAIGQLTGGIAHDFNNLLTIIVGSAEALQDMLVDNPRAQDLAAATLKAAERSADLTSRLLSFGRRQALQPERLHPVQLLAGVERLIRRTITEDIEIEINAAPDVLAIDVDPAQLDNAVLNLVINARDAMPDGGRLTIDACNVTLGADDLPRQEGMKAGRYVMFAVADNGYGMSPDTMEQAFEPFFTSKEVGKGSGLGLSMVWGFVRQSNGHAEIHSVLGEGTTVKLYFPAATGTKQQPESITTPGALPGGTERILVVEDDELVRKHVAEQLRGVGYDIREAASASDALRAMDEGWTFDLLFSDVVMPGGINGKELADEALQRHPGLKVLFTSGYTEGAIVHRGRLTPGADLLPKPYRSAELFAKIRQLLHG